MIQAAEQHGGPAAAAQLRRDLDHIRRLTGGGTTITPWRDPSDMDRDSNGDLLIHPENLPAALAWVMTGDQWIRAGADGEPVAPNVAVALQTIELMRAEAPQAGIRPLETLGNYRIIAGEVLELYRERQSRNSQRR